MTVTPQRSYNLEGATTNTILPDLNAVFFQTACHTRRFTQAEAVPRQFHHEVWCMQAFPTAAQRVLNFDTDLADGLALGALLISHIPRLAFLAAQLNLTPSTPADLQNNAILVIKMTVEIQLPWPLQVPPAVHSLLAAPASCTGTCQGHWPLPAAKQRFSLMRGWNTA